MNERSIFMEALDKDTEAQRSAYLDQTCGADTELRERVEALLQSHGNAGSFLGKPVPQRLAENIASPEESEATQGEMSKGDRGGEGLDFLTASVKPDSLGRLGHYEILETIGRGGMGVVLKAFDEQLHRNVAIKVMAPQLATNAMARKRFVREARAAAAVRNEHVINIHAVEEANELPYLAMEYISGVSLQERLDKSGPLQLAEILRIGMQTAAGLAAAHAQGLIHRDIKPSNILLENGVERVKITDFGLARAVDDVSLTQSGVIAGTPQYMAPEQARGEAVDHRADLFSLGSVMYAMCTGRAPFRASGTMAVLKRVCEDTPRSIREVNPETPDWLSAIIAKLQAKNPADRFQSAAEVAELLSRHLAHLQQPTLAPMPAAASPLSPLGRGGGGEGRSLGKRRLAIAAAVLFCLVAGLSLSEATGVTNLRATVIRIVTPDGTLVVEVDDPGVKVTIEGDGGLVITGAGLEEIRLRPGSYKVQADRDGEKVLLEREVVSIAKGGREVVRVKLEAPPAALSAKPEKGAFVLLAAAEERKFDTLADAVLGASDGDTIEVRGNGPFVLRPIVIPSRLVIRAGPQSRPVFKSETQTLVNLLQTRAPLVLEGLEFHWVAKHNEPATAFLVNAMTSPHFGAAHCRMVVTGRANIISGGKHCEVRNCEFHHRANSAVEWSVRRNGKVIVDGCTIAGLGLCVAFRSGAPDEPGFVQFTRNTVTGPAIQLQRWTTTLEAGDRPIALQATDNVVSNHKYMLLVDRPGLTELSPEGARELVKRLMSYQERRNVYDPANELLGYGWETSLNGPKDVEAWQKFWGLGPTESLMARVHFHGGNLRAMVGFSPEKLSAEHFRLRPDSAGYRAGKDGKDLGADIDLVGPGKAYERWKKTPAYQQWLKDTGQVKNPGPADPKIANPSGETPPVDAKLLAELAGYDATLKENPNDLATLLKRGDVLRRLKRFDDAVASFSQVILNSSNQAERGSALVNRAVTHAERGHLQGAIDDYEEYVRHGAEQAFAYGRLATCYTFGPEKLRNPKRALEHAETAIQKRYAHADFHTLHGVCLYRVGRHREAIEVLERAYQDKAHTAMNRFFAAMTYQCLGEPAKAQECYALALKLPQPTGHPGMIPDWIELMRAEAEAVLKIPSKK